MPARDLTDVICRTATVTPGQKQTDWQDAKVRNLALRVTEAGWKVWVWRYRWQTVRRRLVIGPYGSQEWQLTLARARAEGLQLAALLARGDDPGRTSDKAKRKRLVRDDNTVARAIEKHIERLRAKGKRPNYLQDMRECFDRHVIPVIGQLPIVSVARPNIERLLEPLAVPGKKATHNRVLAMLRSVFDGNTVAQNPCSSFEHFADDRGNQVEASCDRLSASKNPSGIFS